MKFQKKTLEEVADFCLGKMLDKKKNKGDLRPYLANVNVRWGEFDFDNLREMRFEQHELVKFGLEYGDIVMCEGGEPGRCAIWKNQIPAMMIQKALHRIRPHKCLDNHFLYYTFLDYGQTGQFSPLFTGATIKHLPREKLALLEIELPPLPTQRKIASILSAYTPDDQPWLASVWKRLSDGLSAAHKKLEIEEPDWNSWKPWDWCEKRKPGYDLRQTHLGWVGDELVGFLNVWPEYNSQNSPGEKLVYIEHLAATPWNVTTQLWRRKYKAVGVALLAYAAKLSQDLGYGGRFGLHASSSDALNFYRRVAIDRNPALFHPEITGILGPTPHGNPGDRSRTYLETTPQGAINLLEDYRHA